MKYLVSHKCMTNYYCSHKKTRLDKGEHLSMTRHILETNMLGGAGGKKNKGKKRRRRGRRWGKGTSWDGDGASDLSRALAHSFMISADMAHGVHPNYADKHDAQHRPMLNGGPVLKTHSEWRYATDAECSALFRSFCRDAGVPMQEFVNRSDLRCGSTIGPIVSASLGVRGVDVGNAMWSMHSIRETGGSQDQPHMIAVMRHFLGWSE